MNPNDLVLTKLDDACQKLARSGRLTPDDSNTARELNAELDVLIDQSNSAAQIAGMERHIQAHTKELAVRMVDFLERQLIKIPPSPSGQLTAFNRLLAR